MSLSNGGASAADWTIIGRDDLILVTGGAGFIGKSVVANLIRRGFRNIRCLVRTKSKTEALRSAVPASDANIEYRVGNLLSPADCRAAVSGVTLILHLAAGRGEKSYADAFLNSVVTTRNLIDAAAMEPSLRRLVSVSSFTVYTNAKGGLLTESSPTETISHLRGEAYCFAKVKQDELVMNYGASKGIRWVILRPGYVYGPGNEAISSRVGISTFGPFLHMGGSNQLPMTYVENCADAIALAGLHPAADGQIFNVVDDDVLSSREFLRMYKRHVRDFRSMYLPKAASYFLCWLWETYANYSQGQLPLAYNRRMWRANWKSSRHSNSKLKTKLGWQPPVPTAEGMNRYLAACRAKYSHA
jgi:nucleoside-diphosphate-sugar epimerase